jgi:hypothetical protein
MRSVLCAAATLSLSWCGAAAAAEPVSPPGVWYVAEKSGRIDDHGKEGRACVVSEFTPEEFMRELRDQGMKYKLTEQKNDSTTGKPTMLSITYYASGKPEGTMVYYKELHRCKALTKMMGDEVTDMDRYK